jgi:hypothetical protein
MQTYDSRSCLSTIVWVIFSATWILICCFPLSPLAQTPKKVIIKALVTDSASKEVLPYMTIELRKDTSVLKRTITDQKGMFTIEHSGGTGTFNLLIKSMSYAMVQSTLTIKEDTKEIDLGTFKLLVSSVMLDEVVVENNSPVRFRGDTIIFNAGAFGADALDDIETLMQRIPGFEIDENGNIKYNGQSIGMLTVDGFRFFGGAPTTATRSLKVDMIESIEFVLSRTDESIMMDFDDGVRIPKLNLVLKQSRKRFYMSSVHVSGATSERYSTSGTLQSYNRGDQFGVSLHHNNTGAGGETLGNVITFNPVVPSTPSQRDRAMGGQLHYSKTMGKRKEWWTEFHYVFSENNRATERLSLTQDPILNEWLYTQKETQNENGSRSHRLNQNSTYTLRNKTRIYTNFGFSTSQNSQQQFQQFDTRDQASQPINAGKQTYSSLSSNPNVNAHLNYTFKLPKKAGNLNLQSSYSYSKGSTETFNQTLTNLWKEEVWSDSTFQQKGDNQSYNSSFSTNLAYSLRLDSALGMQLSSTSNYTYYESDRQQITFEYNALTGLYDLLVPRLNNQFVTRRQTFSVPLSLNIRRKKWTMTLQSSLRYLQTQGDNRSAEENFLIERNDWVFTPSLNANFLPKQGENVQLTINRNISQPDISSLQPVYNNTNPLILREGNPDLQNSSNVGVNLRWNRQLKNLSNFMFSYTARWDDRVISQSTTYDSVSRIQTIRPINMKGGSSHQWNGNYGFNLPNDWKFLNIYMSLSAGSRRSFQQINSQLNQLDTYSAGGGLGFNIRKDKWTVGLNQSLSSNQSINSNQTRANQAYLNYVPSAGFTYRPEKRWNITGNYSTNYYIGQTQYQFITNHQLRCTLSYQALKDRSLSLNLTANDLLNQGVRAQRSIHSNGVIEDVQSNFVSRMITFRLTYNFRSQPAQGG